MILIVDYGMGNVGSILNMLKHLKIKARISSDISEIETAEKLILPGVGAFDNAIKNLNESELLPILNKKVLREKTPVLGICLGVQLFTKKSEEGKLPGLGWINGNTIRFKFESEKKQLKIPHMGWNTVEVKNKGSLFRNMYPDPRFYFVHSYHLKCENSNDISSITSYGHNFASSIEKNNIYGVQFHPEKSHKFGMKIFENFSKLE